MTDTEAQKIAVMIAANFPATEFSKDTMVSYAMHLRPLPYQRSFDGVHRALIQAWTFPPRLQELMLACGVSDRETTDALMRAIADGGELMRDVRSSTGWSYIAPGDPPPPAYVVEPPPEPPRALPPAGPPPTAAVLRAGGVRQYVRQLAAARTVRPSRPWDRESDLAGLQRASKDESEASA